MGNPTTVGRSRLWSTLVGTLAFGLATPAQDRVRVLFLGDRGHHRPAERMHQVQARMADRGVDLFYTDRVADLTAKRLSHYDCVVLYANHLVLPKSNEAALLAFVESGKGFVPLHCASACFSRSRRFVQLVGGRFKSHGTGVFSVETAKPDHPAVRGLSSFESWDETYVHSDLTEDRSVLQFRVERGGAREPWTWVRTQGKGRVFYTAWGHDQRTWSKKGFLDLVERGIRWASGDRFLRPRTGESPFQYQPAKVPLYEPGVARRDMRNLPSMQKPMSPDDSMGRLRVPPEFRVERFAAEPQIQKPIAMAWDERGRLWIAETTDYPNELKRAGEGSDRIKICEDTDGDGLADKFTIFADKLSIPTSIVPARRGVIVAQAPVFLLLEDTNGDDRADVREVLFSGWSTGDTHAGPSNLRYGFDNQIWGSVGYAGFNGSIGGERHRFRQGFYRFTTDGKKLEFLTSTTNNTWGLAFSEEGFVFGSTANGNPSVYMPIANRYYERVSGWSSSPLATIAETLEFHPVTEKVRQVDWHGKYTAAAGHALYTARSFPRRYWNRAAFVNAPTGHLLSQFFLEPQGTHFVGRDGFNLLASDDEWTAPIMAEVGPDGAVWVIDWYNYIVQHNPTPRGFRTGRGAAYETPLRDKRHGRIYRIVHRDSEPQPAVDLRGADLAKLVATLGHTNMFWRLTAQRRLVETRPPGAVEALLARLRDRGVDSLGLNVSVQHVLWTLHGIGAIPRIDAATRAALLSHEAPAVRRTALQVLPPAAAVAHHARLLQDPDAHVRMATFLALSVAPTNTDVGAAVFAAMSGSDPISRQNMADKWIPDAATMAAVQHDAGFLRAALAQFEVETTPEKKAPENLIRNAGFEEHRDGRPVGWRVRTYGGTARHEFVKEGRDGGYCVKMTSDRGSDTSWYTTVQVEPDATYKLSGWVKTEGIKLRGGAFGALFNAHEIQGARPGRTPGVRGDKGWTRVEATFPARGRTRLGINCLFGGWGHATGTAWYDDVRLERVAGTDLPGKLGRAISRAMERYAGRAPTESVGQMLAAMRKSSPGLAHTLLSGLVAGWPQGAVAAGVRLDQEELAQIELWLSELPPDPSLDVLRLLQRWGHGPAVADRVMKLADALLAQAADAARDPASRVQAVRQLAALQPMLTGPNFRDRVTLVLRSVRPHTDFELAAGFVRALGSSSADAVGEAMVRRWPQFTGRVRKVAAQVLTRRPAWTRALLDGMVRGEIDTTVLTGAEWLPLQNHTDPQLESLAAKARKASPTTGREAVVARFVQVAKKRGDAANGQKLFAAQCAQCHKMNGVGGTLGPILDGSGARSREELLVAILDPNQSVDGTYLMWAVETNAGEFIAGRLDAESKTTIEILDIESKRHVVKRSDIKAMESSTLSLMPATFETLGEKGLADVLEYLATAKEHGKGGK